MMKEKKKIVILGGGFGGLYTLKSLLNEFSSHEIEVTIVNRNNYFLFTPLLHEVATGTIAHHQVVESLRQIIYKKKYVKLHVAELVSVDCINQVVKTSIDELHYDVLVLALGATTNFFNAPGAEEHSFVLKDLSDAISLRIGLIDAFERASEVTDQKIRKEQLSFAVVGGGATGVELVAEMVELISDTFLKYYRCLIKRDDISIYLLNRDPEILMPFHPKLRKHALDTLKKKGVKVMLNMAVKEVKKGSILFEDGSILPVAHVIWTAGVKPNPPMFTHPVELDRGGRVVVNPMLQIKDCANVFVLGDMASFQDENGKPLPMLAQVAVNEGVHTGKNIKRMLSGKSLLPFKYKSQGGLASLGRGYAVADIHGIRFSGLFAWLLWRTIYLFKFMSFSKKFKIAVDWTINIFYPRDITKA
jgi:NADH dehydrogenase